jgi:hypothetical protein
MVFYRLFILLWRKYPKTAQGLLGLIPTFGYIKDWFSMWELIQTEALAEFSKSADKDAKVTEVYGGLFKAIADEIVKLFRADASVMQTRDGRLNVQQGFKMSMLVKWARWNHHQSSSSGIPCCTTAGDFGRKAFE